MLQQLVPSLSGRAKRRQPVILRLSGELDMMSAPDTRDRLRQVLAEHRAGPVVVDLSDVTFMDCSGLRPLLEAKGLLGRRLTLARVPPQVLRLLEVTGTGILLGLGSRRVGSGQSSPGPRSRRPLRRP